MGLVCRTVLPMAILTNCKEETDTTTTETTTTSVQSTASEVTTTTTSSTIVSVTSTTSTTSAVRVCVGFCSLSNRDRFLQAGQFVTLFPTTTASSTSTPLASTFTTTSSSLLQPLTGTTTTTGLPSPTTTNAPEDTGMSTGLVLGSLAGGVAAIALVGYGAAWLMVGTLYLFFSDQVY